MIKINSKKVTATIMAGILFTNAIVTPLTAFASEVKPEPVKSEQTYVDTPTPQKPSLSDIVLNTSVDQKQKDIVKPKKEVPQAPNSTETKNQTDPNHITVEQVRQYLGELGSGRNQPVENQQEDNKPNISTEQNVNDEDNKPNIPAEQTVNYEDNNFVSTGNSSSDVDQFSRDTTSRLIAHKYAQDMTTEGFISSIAEQCREVGQQKHLYASVMIAQAVLESGSGRSQLAEAPNNNLFGIKGSWKDKDGNLKSVSFDTHEDDGTGKTYATHAKFRKYDTVKDSLEDYAQLLTDTEKGMGNFYKDTWKTNNNTYKDACYALQGKYATDTTYAQKLVDIIATYDLTQYDNALDYEIVGRIKDKHAPQEVLDQFGYRKLTMDDYANLEAIATAQLGEKYVWGGQNPEVGFDCSGLVWYAYKNALGIELPRTSEGMAQQGELVKDFNDLRMGDLLFFTRNGDAHHVAMYLGNGYFIQSPHSGDVVKITALKDYMPSFAKRVLTFEKKEAIQEREQKTVFDTHNLQRF